MRLPPSILDDSRSMSRIAQCPLCTLLSCQSTLCHTMYVRACPVRVARLEKMSSSGRSPLYASKSHRRRARGCIASSFNLFRGARRLAAGCNMAGRRLPLQSIECTYTPYTSKISRDVSRAARFSKFSVKRRIAHEKLPGRESERKNLWLCCERNPEFPSGRGRQGHYAAGCKRGRWAHDSSIPFAPVEGDEVTILSSVDSRVKAEQRPGPAAGKKYVWRAKKWQRVG